MNCFYRGHCSKCGKYYESYEPTTLCDGCAVGVALAKYPRSTISRCNEPAKRIDRWQWVVQHPGMSPYLSQQFFTEAEAYAALSPAIIRRADWTQVSTLP